MACHYFLFGLKVFFILPPNPSTVPPLLAADWVNNCTSNVYMHTYILDSHHEIQRQEINGYVESIGNPLIERHKLIFVEREIWISKTLSPAGTERWNNIKGKQNKSRQNWVVKKKSHQPTINREIDPDLCASNECKIKGFFASLFFLEYQSPDI